MPDLGIGEALAAFGGTDLLGGLASLLGFGEGAAPAAVGLGEAAGAGAAGLGATGLGAAGPTVAGTIFDTLAPEAAGGISAAIGGGPTALGTAADFLAAPQAIGGATALGGAGAFGGAADLAASEAGSSGLASGTSGIGASPSISSLVPADVGGVVSSIPGQLPAASSNISGSIAPSQSIANTAGIPGLDSGTPAVAPSAIPATGGAGGAAGIAGPGGLAPVDATSALPSGVPGTAGSNLAGPIAPTGGAGVAATGSSTGISDLLGKVGNSFTNNIPGIALGAAGLGYNILEGQKLTKNQAADTTIANTAAQNSQQMVQSGEALQQYLTNGTLPPAYQQQVDQAIADAKTNAISNAAAQGQSTDPTQNTALAASLAKIEASKAGMQTSVASQLFSSGTSLVNSGAAAAGLSGQLFTSLMNNDTTQAANTGKAIATLAAAMNGKSQSQIGGTTVTVG